MSVKLLYSLSLALGRELLFHIPHPVHVVEISKGYCPSPPALQIQNCGKLGKYFWLFTTT